MKYFAYSLILFLALGIFSFAVVSTVKADSDDLNISSSEKLFMIAQGEGSETEGDDEGSETEGDDEGSETSGGEVTLTNPLGDENTTISAILDNIITGLRDTLAPPIVAIAVLYGGFLMLFSGGNPEKFNQGKKAIGYAVAGYVIIWLASGISALIRSVLTGG